MSQYDPKFDIKMNVKSRSQWSTFHRPVILPYVSKSIWFINIILMDCESVWPEVGQILLYIDLYVHVSFENQNFGTFYARKLKFGMQLTQT